MKDWFDPAKTLTTRIAEVAAQLPDFGADFDPLVRPADPRFGDFQANGVLPLAKKAKANPRALGEQLMAALKESEHFSEDVMTLELAGPGFINITFAPAFRMEWLKAFQSTEDLKAASSAIKAGSKIVIDYSGPNTAKQMHVGHIRSTVIGEALARLLEFAGAEVIRDNHIGDWGTQFGIILHGIKSTGFDLNAEHADPITELEKIYKTTNAKAKEDEETMSAARNELVLLQNGDPGNTKLWEQVCEISYKAFEKAYERFDVKFDYTLGESFYRDQVDRVYAELTELNIAEKSQGALVVFHPEHKRFKEQPFMIRKSDGASNYGTTDLATVLYRVEEFKADEIIYTTDDRQGDHFQQLFMTVEKWFPAKDYPKPKLHHVTFGKILGEDGKAIKTRSGEPVKLADLMDEAVKQCAVTVNEKSPDFPEEERAMIAERVGVNAIRYADLMQNRSSDYKFSWAKMLSFEGNTAPYLLYAVARIRSIFRKTGVEPSAVLDNASVFEDAEEISLARKLMGFASALNQTVDELRPHFLCTYIYELAGEYSSFYNACKVMVDDEAVKERRLLLCSRTLITLETGLRILGIEPLDRM